MAGTGQAERSTYHHGDLRRALLMTGVELARSGGPDAVTLREVSRRLGVSHNAAYRHYADREALVDAVANHGFAGLARAIRVQAGNLPTMAPRAAAIRRLQAVGAGYVAFALRQPGLYRTMFAYKTHPPRRTDGVDRDASLDAFGMLIGALDDLVAVGLMKPRNRPGAEFAAWAAVHGLAIMFIDGPLRDIPKSARQPIIDKTLEVMAAGMISDAPSGAV